MINNIPKSQRNALPAILLLIILMIVLGGCATSQQYASAVQVQIPSTKFPASTEGC
jgi:hypothetical protein